MPQFELSGENEAKKAESSFVFGFIQAMFFTESAPQTSMESWDESTDTADGSIPADSGYAELDSGSLDAIRKFCEAFQVEARAALEDAFQRDYDEVQAGRDLWFTSQGHGVGFWDRDVLTWDGLGEILSTHAGRSDAYLHFENGKVYVEGLK